MQRISKSSKDYSDRYKNYLNLASDIDDYHLRLHEISNQLELSDFSVAEFDRSVNIVQHYQTAPKEMYENSYDPNDINIIGLQAVKQPDKPIYLSDVESSIMKSGDLIHLFSNYLSACNTIRNDFGYNDYYNIPAILGGNNTLLFSVSSHDVSKEELKKRITKYDQQLLCLTKTIAETIPPSIKLTSTLKPREIAVLETVSKTDGTLADVAKKLSITESTVAFHLENARKKTNTRTTSYLVAQAIREKLI